MVDTQQQSAKVTYLDIPDKSENDKKLYKTLILPNGLRVLLVSDPSPVPDTLTSSSYASSDSDDSSEISSSDDDSTDSDTDSECDSKEGDEKLAACALLVDVGSFSEPTEYQGLAHFLEHMIFMGSEKYPSENVFDAHIKKCGGFENANTECEETLFYFEVPEEHLDSSMDYFTALLKGPLMLKDAMTRERDAIESEFQQTLHNDEARRDQLLASLARTDFPHKTFTWGNLRSLKFKKNDDELHKVLHDFRREHYSAHRMIAVVQARLPIEELEQLVIKHFTDIPRNDSIPRNFSKFKYNNAFCPEFHNKVFYVKPVEDVCKLELTWVLPPMTPLYRSKPDLFLSYLIGYEGEGSLCAYLRNKLWGLELISGVDETGFDTNSFYSLFNICIYLTERGSEHIDDVIAATFAFIKLFSECGSLKETYLELQSIEKTSFRFESQKPAFDNVQSLALRVKYYPAKDILTGSELYFEYNEDEIMNVIKHLNEFKCNIMITSHHDFPSITYDKKEEWFGTEYTQLDMPQKWIDSWENCKKMPELYIPKPNCFISTDFRLFWVENGKPDLPMAPKKIRQTNICELWYRQDDKFLLPEGYMQFYFISPLLRQCPRNDVMCALFSQLIKFRLGEELYPATVAGLCYQLYSAEKGLVLKVNGYNEKLPLLVDIIIKAMVSMRVYMNEDQLNVFKDNQKKDYFNDLIKPKTLNKDIRLSIVENIRWPIIEKFKCLNSITLEDMLNFSDIFTNELYVQTLMQGNFTEETAHNVMNSVLSTLNCTNIKETKYIENRTVQLPIESNYIRCKAINDKDINTITCNYYQIGPCTLTNESILDLLMMFVEEPLFDTLRTKEQLGYSVGSCVRVNYGITGYSITVNSQETKFTAAHVEDRIEAFRTKMFDILEKMPDSEFNHVRESLIKIKQVVDMSLSEEVARNWGEITCEDYMFDRRRREIEILRNLDKAAVLDFCLHNEKNNLRKLCVQVIGNKPIVNKKQQRQKKQITASTNVTAIKDDKEATNDADDDDDDNDDDDDDDDDSDDDDNDGLFTTLADKIEMVFLRNDDDSKAIVDIKEFKKNLYVYPITKTKLDSITIEEQSELNKSPVEIIEDF